MKAKSGKRASRSEKPAPARNGSKTAQILELLKRPGGATLPELMHTTGWQAHSVRGFVSGTLGKKMGLTVNSAKAEDGERTYSIKALRSDDANNCRSEATLVFAMMPDFIHMGQGVGSGLLGQAVDAIAILAIVVLNAAIGFYQEFNAEKSIAALKKMTAPLAKVRREGQVTSILHRGSSRVTSWRWKLAMWSRPMPGSWRQLRSSASSPH